MNRYLSDCQARVNHLTMNGAVTWDVPAGMTGKIADAFLEQLAAVGKAVEAK